MVHQYKDAEFYNDYFGRIDNVVLSVSFQKKEDSFFGELEFKNTIHPLKIAVEIPVTFPHHRLKFWTHSLKGYPHLIYNNEELGSWFCLNTPFAETAEEQLNQEMSRLNEWIARQMREDLPCFIEDSNVKKALAFANAYEWENPDEVKEFCSEAMLTFVGNFHSNPENFKENIGYLHCVKSPDDRFYAVAEKAIANHELPYVIVDEFPSSIDVFDDFIKLKEQYGWDEIVCNRLLPDFGFTKVWGCCSSGMVMKKWSEEDAQQQIALLEEELNKEVSYLPTKNSSNKVKVLPLQKETLLTIISEIKENVLNEHGLSDESLFKQRIPTEDDEEYEEYWARMDYAMEVYPYKWHHFALGIRHEGTILWNIFYTNRSRRARKTEKVEFDLGLKTVTLEKTVSHELVRLAPVVMTEEMFYGRGSFSPELKSRKIAIVGLGAIGSMVASALARTGVSKIGLWDDDIVEPGNICRSSYTLNQLGESKVNSIASIIKSINPYIETTGLKGHGGWLQIDVNTHKYVNGSFYANVNYNTQEKALEDIKGYDLIIDCTGSNEMLHFLSYALPDTHIISLCITNHANELLCITNRDGNPFELRKAYLSRIEQDTRNFYVEGSGCYSPTFLATNCDIAALVNLALRDMNSEFEGGSMMHSVIYSHSKRGVVADRLSTYRLHGYDIKLSVSTETLFDAEEMDDVPDGEIGYLLGCYSHDGRQIMITHIVDSFNAAALLTDAYRTSNGIIDYIGDYCYSGAEPETYNQQSFDTIAVKAADEAVNTNNPLLAVRNPDGSVIFFLYINNELVRFYPVP